MKEYPAEDIKSIQKKMSELQLLSGQLQEMMKTCISSTVLHTEQQEVIKEYKALAESHRMLILESKAPKLLGKRITKIKRKRGRPRKEAA